MLAPGPLLQKLKMYSTSLTMSCRNPNDGDRYSSSRHIEESPRDARPAAGSENPGGGGLSLPCAVGGEIGRKIDD